MQPILFSSKIMNPYLLYSKSNIIYGLVSKIKGRLNIKSVIFHKHKLYKCSCICSRLTLVLDTHTHTHTQNRSPTPQVTLTF